MLNMYGTKRMTVKKLLIQVTGTYNQQFRRPYQSSMDNGTHNRILEVASKQATINSSLMAGADTNFIHLQATPESDVSIANGWGTQRLRFLLELAIEDQMGMPITEYVVGYTDYADLSFGNLFDPQTTFFVNGINMTRATQMTTPLGTNIYQTLIDSSHVLVNHAHQGALHPSQLYNLSPQHIFDKMGTLELDQDDTGMLIDTRGIMTSSATKSKRANSISPVYTSTILDAYLQTQRAEDDVDQTRLLDISNGLVQNNTMSTDYFMSYIHNQGRRGNGNHFKWEDLIALDPNVANVTVVVPIDHAANSGLHRTGLTANWGASNYETVFAATVSQSLPGYLLGCGINKVHFLATNYDSLSGITINIANIKSLSSGGSLQREAQALIFKLTNELFKGLSQNGQLGFSADIRCDLLGETWITLSINGQAEVTYTAPSFCDALTSPVVTNSTNAVTSIAHDFNTLLHNITEHRSSNNNWQASHQPQQAFGLI